MKHPDLLEPLGASAGGEAVHAARRDGLGLVIDNFAGGGGASTGIEQALGRAIDVAINHDGEAIAMHRANHPATRHYCQSVWAADPERVVAENGGGPVALAWFSPDCKHFSKAKGGKPVEKNIRDLAWVVVLWAQRVKPRVIMLENVEEFKTWGPLLEDGKPCPVNKGLEYRRWMKELKKAGYRVEDRELRACDYGAPTSRKRLFVIARSDGEPIVWPAPTHGKPGSPGVGSGQLQPWRTAAEIIDWSIPCPSIFERKKPLKDATCRRIAHGIMRFVVNSPKPFIVPVCHTRSAPSARSGDEPLQTVTTAKGGELAVVEPFLAPLTHHGPASRLYSLTAPIPTVTGAHRGEIALVAPVFARTAHGERDASGKKRGKGDHGPEETFPTVLSSQDSALISCTIVGCGGRRGQSGPVDPRGPYPVTTAKADACLVAATLVKANFGSNPAQAVTVPLHTITTQGNRFGLLSATLIQAGYGEREGQAPRVLDLAMPLGTIVAGGIKHSIACASLISVDNTSTRAGRYFPLGDPVRTITSSGGGYATVAAFLHKYRPNSPGADLGEPAPTITANSFIKRPGGAPPISLVCAHMEQANTGVIGHAMGEPVSTIVQKGCTQRLVASSLVKLRGTSAHGQPADEPLHTISAQGTHFAEVAAFLVKYYGAHQHGQGVDRPLDAVTAKARFGLITVTIDGEEYVIADIGMRMLSARELARAQGFPANYVLEPIVNGKPLTKTAQIRMIGNSVCPPLSCALVGANLGRAEPGEEAEAA